MSHRQLSKHLITERAKLEKDSKNYELRNQVKLSSGFKTQRSNNLVVSPNSKKDQLSCERLTEYAIFS